MPEAAAIAIAPDDTIYRKSVAAFVDEMERAEALGASYLVTHPGAHTGSGDLPRNIARRFTIDGYATGLHPVAGLAAAAVAEVGEKLVEAAHRNRAESG